MDRTISLPISELHLWDENARFPDKYYNQDEQVLLKYFLSKDDFKVRQLIDEIAADFDMPQLEKLVVWQDEEDRYIVLEGNRRLAAYKLLLSPRISEDNVLIQHINSLNCPISNATNIECIIVSTKEKGLRYIDRKHIKSNNEVNWQEPERANYRIRRNTATRTELIKTGITKMVMSLEDIPEEMKEAVLGRGFVTTFFRIVASTLANSKYEYNINEDGAFIVLREQQFKSELSVIINDVLNRQTFHGKRITSRDLNREEAIEDYLNNIKETDESKVKEQIHNRTSSDIFGESAVSLSSSITNNKQRVLPKSIDRSYLIPSSCRLSILEPKINNIYRELREGLLIDNSTNTVPNAVGILFRVFIEISIDCFLEKKGVTLKKDVKLSGKINKCCDMMESEQIASNAQLHNIRKVAENSNDILNINNFHDYVHSMTRQPLPNDLKLKWDNLQEFFQILWQYLYLKEKNKNL